MDIKELAKKLCDESGCHHKCKEIDECVVMEEAEELLINQNKSNNFDVKSNEELFKQALVEGVNNHIDKTIEKEKQIEEMAKVIAKADDTCRAKTIAKALYNAGYRKHSENTVELPCKVGDMTYIFDYKVNNHLETKFRGITPSVVEAITIVDDGLWIENEHAKYHISSVGDLIFFTKEEAEQTLAKMKGGEE